MFNFQICVVVKRTKHKIKYILNIIVLVLKIEKKIKTSVVKNITFVLL